MTTETAGRASCSVTHWSNDSGRQLKVESHYYRRTDGVWTCLNCGTVKP